MVDIVVVVVRFGLIRIWWRYIHITKLTYVLEQCWWKNIFFKTKFVAFYKLYIYMIWRCIQFNFLHVLSLVKSTYIKKKKTY